jgi:hypothetical protein
MREWLLLNELTTEAALQAIETDVKNKVREDKQAAWDKYINPIKAKINEMYALAQVGVQGADLQKVNALTQELINNKEPLKRDIFRTFHTLLEQMPMHPNTSAMKQCLASYLKEEEGYYGRHLYNQTAKSTLNVSVVDPIYDANSKIVNGFEVLNQYFDQLFESNPFVWCRSYF